MGDVKGADLVASPEIPQDQITDRVAVHTLRSGQRRFAIGEESHRSDEAGMSFEAADLFAGLDVPENQTGGARVPTGIRCAGQRPGCCGIEGDAVWVDSDHVTSEASYFFGAGDIPQHQFTGHRLAPAHPCKQLTTVGAHRYGIDAVAAIRKVAGDQLSGKVPDPQCAVRACRERQSPVAAYCYGVDAALLSLVDRMSLKLANLLEPVDVPEPDTDVCWLGEAQMQARYEAFPEVGILRERQMVVFR